MLKGVYVIDYIVRDLDAAVEYWRKILGVEPIDTSGVGDDVSEFRMAHFPAPGDGRGVHSIGFFQLTTDTPRSPSGIAAKQYLDQHGEGPMLIGFTVKDVDAVLAGLRAQGLNSLEPEPVRYQMGRGFTLPARFGTRLWFAQHDPDGYEKFLKMGQESSS